MVKGKGDVATDQKFLKQKNPLRLNFAKDFLSLSMFADGLVQAFPIVIEKKATWIPDYNGVFRETLLSMWVRNTSP